MTNSKAKKKDDAPPKSITTKANESKTTSSAPKHPPVEAAAHRLERLFGGSSSSTSSSSTNASPNTAASSQATTTTPLIQPAKILKKWLGSSSGTAGKATLAQIASCAERTLDPAGKCATGRELLMGLATEEERNNVWKELLEKQSLDSDGDKKKEDVEKNKADDEKDKEAMEEDEVKDEATPPPITYLVKSAREVESWLVTLAIRIQWRAKNHQVAYEWTGKGLNIMDAHLGECSSATAGDGGVGGLYPLLARLLRYRSLALESLPVAARSALVASHRPELAGRHTTAVLRRDADVSAVVLNIMLRDLLEGDQVEQAQKLLSNATFPTETASNNQLVRYLYYSGRIQALRLEYTQAYSNLSQALRKCPSNTGLGFRIAAQRLLVVVQLLMGEIPDRSVFFGEGMSVELKPYLEIAQAVRRGDLAVFHATVSTHAHRLRLDGTYTLISRLAHSVVKAGLRRLKTSYSRISLADVATRLGLPSATSAEFVVAKAVRDGVIDATIDHEKGYVQSHDLVDVYATVEPSEAFHRRIAYCLTTHNDALRAMRYTPDAYKKQLEASRGLGRRGRGDDDDKTDEEKAKEIEDELDEDY
mmetsp:Transcript_13878/g.29743  ORF Transcript_13878/g.29743 Transcript_13878/m.29743 type:complete len:591 (+) Transcript_13878:51-1823(+)